MTLFLIDCIGEIIQVWTPTSKLNYQKIIFVHNQQSKSAISFSNTLHLQRGTLFDFKTSNNTSRHKRLHYIQKYLFVVA